jgi:hypothetical protein
MSRPLVKSVEKKLRITLAVLHGCTRRGFDEGYRLPQGVSKT